MALIMDGAYCVMSADVKSRSSDIRSYNVLNKNVKIDVEPIRDSFDSKRIFSPPPFLPLTTQRERAASTPNGALEEHYLQLINISSVGKLI